MTRDRKFSLFLASAIVGGVGICVAAIPVVGNIRNADTVRVVAGTLVVALAMAWACFFVTRAHFAQDEFKRQREIWASFWGGWLGIAASAPIFFFLAVGGLEHLATVHVPPVEIFTIGYLLPTICGGIGALGMRLWLRHRDG